MIQIATRPLQSEWAKLSERSAIGSKKIKSQVTEIMSIVRAEGDVALRKYTKRFDRVDIENISIQSKTLKVLAKKIPQELKSAIDIAYQNIYQFHEKQQLDSIRVETMEGVECWRESRPIQKVGLYIPGGSAPLFSTVLMLGIPAKIAGCKNMTIATPPIADGKIDPAIAYCALKVGVHKLYQIGGAQAIAALAIGTETVDKVDKIFGPGNQYVTEAKMQAQNYGVAIDMPAGPSEVLVIADEASNPEFIVADLLSQLEHGPDSQAILCTNSPWIAENVILQLEKQLEVLPRKEIILESLDWSKILVFESIEDCFDFSNSYAPEHLILNLANAEEYIDFVQNAGSVFIGKWSCESIGDYASGTNHTLPTSGYAKAYSGVSLDSFIKKITFQNISAKGLSNIGPVVETLASAEGLIAHMKAVSLRLKSMQNE